MGFIDATSLKWLDLPSNASESYFAYIKYDDSASKRINLGDKNRKFSGNQVVTGKFYYLNKCVLF
jgi:hypothetical protein